MLKKFTKATGDDYVWSFESTVCVKSLYYIYLKCEPTFHHYLIVKIYFIEIYIDLIQNFYSPVTKI